MIQKVVPGMRKIRTYTVLLAELTVNEPDDYRNFSRMDPASLDELLGLVTPFIQKERHFNAPIYTANGTPFINLAILGNRQHLRRSEIHHSYISPKSIGQIVIL